MSDRIPDRHPLLSALDDIDMGWLQAFAEQGAEDIAGVVQLAREPQFMDNPKAVGAPKGWQWGYLPCGCRNDGFGNHVR